MAGNECQEGLECLGGHFSLEDGEDLAWVFFLLDGSSGPMCCM